MFIEDTGFYGITIREDNPPVYPKTMNVFIRSEITHKLQPRQWQYPFYNFKNLQWIGTEKVDGTNVRVAWWNGSLKILGRRNRSQIPSRLLEYLNWLFNPYKNYRLLDGIVLYGEGYGGKIQKRGKDYSEHENFVVFDIKREDTWFTREQMKGFLDTCFNEEGHKLNLVPILRVGTLTHLVREVSRGIKSDWGNFQAEGLVVTPSVLTFYGQRKVRLKAKLKTKDLKDLGISQTGD